LGAITQSPNQASLNAILSHIREEEWLSVSAGSASCVSPVSAHIGVPNGYVDGFHLINPDILDDGEWHLLTKIGVTTVESTQSLNKLISTVEAIAAGCSHHRQIKGPLLSAYRQLIKRINRILLDSDREPERELLNRLPLFYESGGVGERGIASKSDQVLYVSGSHRSTRSKLDNHEIFWWLAGGDIGTLANYLSGVSTLTTDANMVGMGSECSDHDLRDLLENEYLPTFMTLACYGDIPGLTDIDEAIVQRRWQSLEVASIAHAELHEAVGSVGESVQETITSISEAILLWEPLRADQKKKLSLFVDPGYCINQVEFKRRVCVWFAEEVFRRRELIRYFEQVVLEGLTLEEFGVSPAVLKDARDVIREWFPDDKLDQLLSELTSVVGVDVTKKNWRDTSIYANAGLRFDQLLKSVSSELHYYIASLNPIDRNGFSLLSFVDSHVRNLAALEDFCDLQHEGWLSFMDEDSSRFDFSFDPELFVLSQVSLDKTDFCLLGERVDLELQKIEKEDDSVAFNGDISSLSGATSLSIVNGGQGFARSGYLAAAKSDEDHAAQQLKNAKAGKTVEKYLAIKTAKRIATLPIEKQKIFLSLIQAEYSRLIKYRSRSSEKLLDTCLLESAPPYTELKWLEIIHIGGVVDGAGYDYLDFDDENKQVLLVEAKSTKLDSPLIYISEPERCHIVKYASNTFVLDNPSSSWRMFLKTNERYVDVTEVVRNIVLTHHAEYSLINSCMKPTDWVIEGVSIA